MSDRCVAIRGPFVETSRVTRIDIDATALAPNGTNSNGFMHPMVPGPVPVLGGTVFIQDAVQNAIQNWEVWATTSVGSPFPARERLWTYRLHRARGLSHNGVSEPDRCRAHRPETLPLVLWSKQQ